MARLQKCCAGLISWRSCRAGQPLRFAANFPLDVKELRIDLPPMEIWVHWYWRMNYDPGHQWLRSALVDLYRLDRVRAGADVVDTRRLESGRVVGKQLIRIA